MSGNRFVDNLHVTLLTRNEVRAIANKYPKDHPSDLLMDALAEIELPPVQYAHIKGAEVFGNSANAERSRLYVGSRLDSEGARRMNQDVARILGYFGLERTAEINRGRPFDFHVSFMKMQDDKQYADYQAKAVGAAVGDRQPIALSHPVIEHRVLGTQNSSQSAAVYELSTVRRIWPGVKSAA